MPHKGLTRPKPFKGDHDFDFQETYQCDACGTFVTDGFTVIARGKDSHGLMIDPVFVCTPCHEKGVKEPCLIEDPCGEGRRLGEAWQKCVGKPGALAIFRHWVKHNAPLWEKHL